MNQISRISQEAKQAEIDELKETLNQRNAEFNDLLTHYRDLEQHYVSR